MIFRLAAVALRCAGLLVPEAGERARWRARWPDGLSSYAAWLASRELPDPEVRRRLWQFFREALAEAMAARGGEGMHRRFRSPWAALLAPLAVLAASMWWSNGFESMRVAARPFDARLVTATPGQSFFGKSPGFTSRQFALVRQRAKSYEAMAGFSTRLNGFAFATPELFPLLGLAPGEAYVAEHMGRSWVGRWIDAEGRRYKIAGVWPKRLRIAMVRPDFWIAEEPAAFAARRYDTTLIARLAPGATLASAAAELADIMIVAPRRPGTGTPTAIVPLTHAQAQAFQALRGCFAVLVLGLIVFAAVRAVRGGGWRKEGFFLAKTLPPLTGILALANGSIFAFWWTGILAALVIWWAWRDQAMRCPECLTRMTLSVQIGTHGAPLLEGVGDEVLCEYGHGSLWVPGVPSQAFGPEVWRGQ